LLIVAFGDVNSAAGSSTSTVNLLGTPNQGFNTIIDTTR
jgi:hypothetical protein